MFLSRLIRTLLAALLSAILFLAICALTDRVIGPVVGLDRHGSSAYAYLASQWSYVVVTWALSTPFGIHGPSAVVSYLQQDSLAAALLVRLALVAAVSVVIGSGFAFWSGRKAKNKINSGMQFLKHADAIAATNRRFKQIKGKQGHQSVPQMYLAPDVPMTVDQETQGVFLEGGIGSGKTVIMRYLMQQAIARGDKVIIYDVKGDFGPTIKDRLLLNPFAKQTARWDISADVISEDQARQLAAMLIPSGVDGERFWSQAGQALLAGVFIILLRTKPKAWTFLDAYRLLLTPMHQLVPLLRQHYPVATQIVQGNDNNMEAGVVATAVAGVAPFLEPLALAWGEPGSMGDVSFRAWLSKPEDSSPNVLILQGSPEHQDAAAAWIRMAVNLMAGVVLSPALPDYGSQRIWFFLDELPSLGAIPRLKEIVDRGRSKGMRIVMACQNLYQLEGLYGDWAKSADANFGIRIYGRMLVSQRSRDICNFVGDQIREVTRVQTTRSADQVSTTERIEQVRVPVLTPEDLTTLGVNVGQGVDAIVIGAVKQILLLSWPFPKRVSFHPAFEPAELDGALLRHKAVLPNAANASAGAVLKSINAQLADALEEFDTDDTGQKRVAERG